MIHRLLAGIAGLAVLAVAAWGIVSSMSGLPRFSPRSGFISELAVPWNPYAGRLNESFVAGGVLIVLFAAASTTRARSGRGRLAGLLTAAAGMGVLFVGVFPLTSPWLHLIGALAAGLCALVAGVVGASAARRAARANRDNPLLGIGSALALALGLLAVAAALGAVGYTAWISAGVGVHSLDALFRALPRALRVDWHGHVYNPVAVLEWIFFAVLGLELGGFAVAELSGLADRARQSHPSTPAEPRSAFAEDDRIVG